MFSRRLSEIDPAEIHDLIAHEIAEGYEFELKRELPAKSGSDPWAAGGKIGEYAKDVLAAEVIAFANGGGGVLVVGIGEDSATKRAVAPIVPVRDCKKAAEALHQSIEARVEPRLPVFECEGVVTESDGSSGVIVMRTLQSYLGPHRHTQDRHCYARRNDRADPMGMIEIQELTRRNARSLEEIDRAFAGSAERFFEWIPDNERRIHPSRSVQTIFQAQQDGSNLKIATWALRVTAKPIAPVPVPTPLRATWLSDLFLKEFKSTGALGSLRYIDWETTRPWVPRLRSVEREFSGDYSTGVDRLGFDGQIDRFMRGQITDDPRRPGLLFQQIGNLLWNVASMLDMLDVVRKNGSRPTQPYALEVEFMGSEKFSLVGYPGMAEPGRRIIPPGRVVLPRYEVGARSDFDATLNIVDRDIWNYAGHEPTWTLAFEW